MPQLADTHAHLYLENFDKDLASVVQRAEAAGVEHILLPNIDSSTTVRLKETCNSNAVFKPMMGLHPCSVKPETYQQELAHVKQELDSGYHSTQGQPYIAVGEIGIDLYWDKSTLAIQAEAFEQQMEWAKALKLPVAIHCRDSFDEIFASVENVQDGSLRGVLHCFTGNEAQAKRCLELGLHLGLGGVLTFKNSGVDKAIENIPIEWLLLETDAPYLAPTPHRGKRNESAYTALVAEKLADVKQMSVEDVGRITTQNAQKLFNL